MNPTPTTGLVRCARTAVLVAAAFGLAGLAHTAAGGRLPSALMLLPLVAPVSCLAYLATGRQVGRRTTAALLGGLQLLLHEAFSVLGGHLSDPARADLDAGSGHLHGHLHATALATGPADVVTAMHPALAAHPGTGSSAAVAMLTLHVVATVLLALALAGTDQALWRIWNWLRPLFRAVAAVALFPWNRPSTPVENDVRTPVLARVSRRRRRRGPPAAQDYAPAA